MRMNEVLLGYQARVVELTASASRLRSGQTIARAVMGVAIIAVLAIVFLAVARRTVPLSYSLLPVPLVIFFGRMSTKRNSALLKSLRLEAYYRQGIARLEGRWAGSGVRGEEFARSGHPYDRDLHLFGEGSLFELLCTCRTEVGRRQLAEHLLDAPDLQDVLERQAAVRELQSRSDLREEINLLGEFSFQDSSWNTIADWLESPAVGASASLRAFALGMSICLTTLLLLGVSSIFAWSTLVPWMAAILVIHSALGLRYRSRVVASLQAIRSVGLEIGVLRQGLELLQSQKFNSALLSRFVDSSKQHDAPAAIRRLERLIGALSERNKEWFYAISRALLVGTQVFWAIEEWRFKNSETLAVWLSAWGEFESLMALAGYAYEHPDNAFPRFLESETALEGKNMGHPLLPVDTCVRNDVSLNEQTRFYVISGSNMAGKSTLIRAIGLNAVLAYSGATVCAEALSLSSFSVCASLSVQDSLLTGRSKFLAEMDRLKQALDLTAGQKPVLFLIDELLGGTNSRDRRIAAEAIVRALIQGGAQGVLSTHDLALTELATLADLRGANVHLGSKDNFDPLKFDYKLGPGVTNESNALAIARLAGVSV